MRIDFEERVVPGDGNCLFYSLGEALGLAQGDLRMAISLYLIRNAKNKYNGLSLEEWVRLETDMKLKNYCELINRNGVWGGNMELGMTTRIFKVNIFVLKREMKKYKMITSYIFDNNARNIFLIYDGYHYNYLKVVKNLAGLKI